MVLQLQIHVEPHHPALILSRSFGFGASNIDCHLNELIFKP